MRSLLHARTGPPEEVLTLAETPIPVPGPDEVLVRVSLAPVHPSDLNLITGTYGEKPPLPHVPGGEGFGHVAAVGEALIAGFRIGQPVSLVRRCGTWRDYVAVPARALCPLPEGVDPAQAALLGINPATAWSLLSSLGAPEPGRWIVQNLASSSVGRCVIQIAREWGLPTCNLVRNPALAEELLALGATSVLEDEGDVTPERAGWPGEDSAPALALNGVGGESALRLMNALRPGGTLVTYGAMGRRPLKVPNGLLIFKNLVLRGFWMSRWFEGAPPADVAAVYHGLARLVAAGRLTQPVLGIVPVERFPEAIAHAGTGQSGKMLLSFD